MNDPGAVEEAMERARALAQARDLDGAARLCREVLALDPARVDAWFMQGVIHAERGDAAQARSHLQRAFELQPAQPPANHLVYADVLVDAGEYASAEAHARTAVRGSSRWPPRLMARARGALASALVGRGAFAEAIEVLTAALDLSPDDVELTRGLAYARWRLARSLHQSARVFDAIDEYRAALALDDTQADYWNDLANACSDAGLLDEAQRAYRETLKRNPGYHQAESNLLINLHYDPAYGPQAMFEAHRAWAKRHAAPLRPVRLPTPRLVTAGERLRVGFLSPGFHWGPSGIFALPVIENLDPRRFETFCYRVGGRLDAVAQRIRSRASVWRDLLTEDDETIARRIHDDRLDVLMDLSGHTPGGRLLVLARKPAPVIATWLDYFDTTGLDAVDYLVGDPVSTPEHGTQRFSETVVRIVPCRLCYTPPDYAADIAPAPAVSRRFVTFGSFNRLPKLAPPVIASWARILDAVPGSRLLLKNAAFVDHRTRERLQASFAAHGVDPDRIEVRADSPHPRMLAEYGDVDIALDPFPYNGGLTTCEALWMGVPVLALLGDSMISRQSGSILNAAGLADWIARSPEELVRIAVQRSDDVGALAGLRRTMRERLRSSPLVNAARFGARFGELIAAMAAQAAAGLPGK